MVDAYEREQQALHDQHMRERADRARIDWLQGRVVDTIYLDDGKIVDVRGGDLRKALDAAKLRWPTSLADDDAEEKISLPLQDGTQR